MTPLALDVETPVELPQPPAAPWKLDEDYLAALHFVNTIRAEEGRPLLDELPQGDHSNQSCVVAVGCGGGWQAGYSLYDYSDPRARRERAFPASVSRFIRRFDGCEFPALEAKRAV